MKVFLSSFYFYFFKFFSPAKISTICCVNLIVKDNPRTLCWKRRQNGLIVIVVEAGGGEWLPSRHTVASSCASTHLLSSYLAEKSTVIACHITG